MPEIGLRVSRHPAVEGLEAIRGVGVAADIVRHAHARLVVGLCLSGSRRIVSGGGQWLAGAGQGFVIPAGVAHACSPAGPSGHAYVVLAVSTRCFPPSRRVAGAVHAWPRLWRDPEAAKLLLATARAASGNEGNEGDDAGALSLFAQLAERLDLRPAPPPTLHPATLRAKAAIDAAPALPVTVAELAGLAGVSPFHLERLFARDLGLPLGEYVLSRRVALAAARIGAGEPLSQAALDAGFYDQSHLTRHFRRRMGVPPGKYVFV